MTSTMSVYPLGAALKEEEFDPFKYQGTGATTPAEKYAEGKRAAEHVFANQTHLKYAFPRFPLVVGEDDYTHRLLEHIRKVRDGVPLYFPKLDAGLSFILSEDAARALLWLIENRYEGAYNFASKSPLILGDLIDKLEKITGKKAQLLTEESLEHWSPFGIPQDWYLDVAKSEAKGFQLPDMRLWLDSLLEKLHGSIQIKADLKPRVRKPD